MSKTLRLLLVEDSDDDEALLLRELRRSGFTVAFRRVETAPALKAALAEQAWDLVLCDYTLPLLDAPTALRLVQASGIDVPFIIVSGTIGEERAVESMRAGAHDFVLKDRMARLGAAVEREVTEASRRAEQARMREQLRQSEVALARSEKLRALGQMAAGITHDLRNTLGGLTLLESLFEAQGVSPRLMSPLRVGVSATRHLMSTLSTLHQFAAGSLALKEEPIDLSDVLRDALA